MSIFYTILPLELVFDGFEDGEDMQLYELPIPGGTLVVEPLSKNQAKIVQVISSDPQLFLNPNLQPGKVIDFSPQLTM